MIETILQPWPWYVAGPLIGLMVPALLLFDSKRFGISSSLRHICAATIPSNASYFKYDWKQRGGWNLLFALGMIGGGTLAATVLGDASADIALAPATIADLQNLGIQDFSGLVPDDVFSWSALTTLPGFLSLVVGGFLVGFGARYANGCTSGHGITGLASFQMSSLVAVIGFFIGGLIMTYFILPLIF
ncbi:MAG: YeeE/YedE family protein [Rhodothermales bacterium]|nr:YeeE/YedE family protein [Rhodothermales bacterium]